ncbi:hypothetical protein RUM43_005981 [Polyplax serrata]|uniref:Uncharacterized protein n=1 Tax=Polyplax serrata TaxID=468196 RepID=A0AAN8NR70_POLSC
MSDNVIKASKFGNLKLLKTLHGEGNSLLSIDSSGETALHHSARDGHKDVVKYLIASAPSSLLDMTDNIKLVKKYTKGRTALHVAAAHKRRSICCLLIAGGASATRRDYDGKTPRLLALEAEDNELAAYLENQEHFKLVSNETETAV